MFNLDHAIAEWRRQMIAAGIKLPQVLDELESHLREDIVRRIRSGMPAEKAFDKAIEGIGEACALRDEFRKVGMGTLWQRVWRAMLRLVGFSSAVPGDFTASARETLDLGRQEALGFHHDFIGTEHVLLGLLATESGTVAKVLQKMGASREAVRYEIGKIVGPGPQREAVHELPYTPRVKKALEIASKEARTLERSHIINTEHIFIGLVLEGGGVAALVLKRLGIDVVRAREEILKELRKA